jgi:hypothetical protein
MFMRSGLSSRCRCRDQEVACTAEATGLSPPTSSSVWCRVSGSSSRAAMTAATSARGTAPAGTGGAASWTRPVAGASVRLPGRRMVQSRSRARRSASAAVFAAIGGPDFTAAGSRRRSGSHRGDLHEPAGPGPFGGIGHQHRGGPVDGVLARRAAARTGASGEHHRVSPGQQHRDITGRGRLQVADDGFGAGLVHIGDVGRVPDQPDRLVTAVGQKALQQQRDFPCPPAIITRMPPPYFRDHRQRRLGRLQRRRRPPLPGRPGRLVTSRGSICWTDPGETRGSKPSDGAPSWPSRPARSTPAG